MKVLLSNFLEVVRLIGLEPTRPKSPDPKRHELARPNDEGFVQNEKAPPWEEVLIRVAYKEGA
ncbi:MAG: hypothetical protein ACI4UC_00800 [Alloprevotella sp.]